MITISIQGDKEVAARLGSLPGNVQKALDTKIRELTLRLQTKVKVEHLSGPTGAHTLSVGKNTSGHTGGQLRSSVFQKVESGASGIVGSVGYSADVPYAAIHEFGGTVNHPGGTAYLIDKATGMSMFISNKNAIADQLPRTKPHAINMPERAPLRTAFEEMKPDIIAGIKQAVGEGLRK